MKLKLRAVGTSTGVIFPKELLHRLNVKKDDVLYVTETPDGFLLSPLDPELEEQLRVGREIMKKHRETLSALAK